MHSLCILIIVCTIIISGYGHLQLNSNSIDGTPLELSVCTSVLSCPFSASMPSLYTAQLHTVSNRSFTNQVSLVLSPNVLLPENSYRFKLSVTDDLGHKGFSEMDVSTESLPVNGRVEISPESGAPLDTVFEARALGWTDKVGDGPFFYRFGFRYDCPPSTDVGQLQHSGSKCMQWMTGLSLENGLRFRIPASSSDLVVQVEDRHGAVQEIEVSLDSSLNGNDSTLSYANLEVTDLDVFYLLDDVISVSAWRDSLSGLISLVWSVHQDSESIVCDGSLAYSPTFNLSSMEEYDIKTRVLRHLTSQLYYEIPLTDSNFQLVLALLDMVTKFKCHGSGFKQTFHQQNDVTGVLSVVEDIINHSLEAGGYGNLATRGLTTHNIALILSIYKNLFDLTATPAWSEPVRPSFMRVVPKVGFGACTRHSLLQSPVVVRQDGFVTFKTSHTNLPYDYSTDSCSESSCTRSPVGVSFDPALLVHYLQWECSASDSSSTCSGVCLTTLQMELDLFWQGNAFSSLHKTSILHLALLNPVSGIILTMDLQNSSRVITAEFPLTSVFAESSSLDCVVWEETILSWVGGYCDTTVTTSSSVSCRCQLLASSYISVLEKCPSGFYGETCNQSKLFDHTRSGRCSSCDLFPSLYHMLSLLLDKFSSCYFLSSF